MLTVAYSDVEIITNSFLYLLESLVLRSEYQRNKSHSLKVHLSSFTQHMFIVYQR